MSFERVAIVNRGEAAMRFINAAAELGRRGSTALTTIAMFTEPDRHAWFVREADEAVCIGPAARFDERLGRSVLSYLDYERLERGLVASHAEAVWVGWGFVAEHAEFADLCDKLGIVFIGPSGDAMRRVGDKIAAKRLAADAGVPVIPWSGGPVAELDAASDAADQIGYPLFVKATSGGGGRGIRRVANRSELDTAFEVARMEARHAFGDQTVFLERDITGARHVEVQVIADRHGATWAVGLRDCTLQRRHQKVIEESACTLLDAEQEREIRHAARELCQRAGYTNAGTVEFLYAPATRSYYFMEVNARLQVEHPVTELTTGVDLVKLQIEVARGARLSGEPPGAPSGHAIEARLNAEDPDNYFAPAPGRIRWFRPPAGPGIRVDTGIAEGDEIAAEYDSMIAKILAWGRDREEARVRLARALEQTQVIVDGGRTNKAFLLTLLDHPDVVAGAYDTGWIDARMTTGELLERRHADVALMCAAIEAYDVEHAVDRASFYADVTRGRPGPPADSGHRIEFRYRGPSYVISVYQVGPTTYRVDVGASVIDVEVERFGTFERRVFDGSRHYRVVSSLLGPIHTVEVEGITHTIEREEGGVIRAPAPAVIVSIAVSPGDEVAVGDPLVVLESMKMESTVTAEFPGRVTSVLVAPNVQVGAHTPLLKLEPLITDEERDTDGPVAFEIGDRPGNENETAGALRAYLLGYDLDAATTRRITHGDDPFAGLVFDSPERLRAEDEILHLFADLCAISRRRPEPAEEETGERVRAPEEHLLTCLRTFDRPSDGLPVVFRERLLRVLRHYGLDDLTPSSDVADALMRVYRSQQRLDGLVGAVAGILDRRVAHVDELRAHATDELQTLLDHIVAGTDGRYPSLNDLAREVRFRFFEQPVLLRAEAELSAAMDRHLEMMGAGTGARTHMAALVECPQPMRPTLLRWYRRGDARARDVALEVATRRYYRIRDLTDVRLVDADGRRFAVADYDHAGRHFHVMVAYAPVDELTAVLEAARRHFADVPANRGAILDLHLWQDGEPDDVDVVAGRLRRTITATDLGRPAHRVDVTITAEPPDPRPAVTYHYTFRSRDGEIVEDALYRNLHPMLAKRLAIERLRRFVLTRLYSAEDVYLFLGVARDNPKDERLFVLAEVRDLTPVSDEAGRAVAFPLLERILTEILAGVRRFQSSRPPERRLLENLVILYVRPPWTVPVDYWRDLAHALAPVTHGLGIERVIALVGMLETDGGLRPAALHVTNPGARGVVVYQTEPDDNPIEPLDEYGQKVLQTQRRGSVYPYELIRLLTPPEGQPSDFPAGDFVEYDLDDEDQLVAVDRPAGQNTANLVVGVIRNVVPTIPEGMRRVLIAGDPSRSLGSLAEAECRRIIAALDLAELLRVPLEWFALSSGARISMTSGTENMDWIGAVLQRIITFTQAGGEINIVVTGINVGAQPYWNAEATMLMHTRGILVMVPESAMVLTGKQALDFSGGVSAEDNLGIGGFERIMGPNGQAQYAADDIESACEILFRHYDHTYVVPGERFPRRATTSDPFERDVCRSPHVHFEGSDFTTVGDIFSSERNPERKKAFDIRSVIRAASDQDHAPLERWGAWQDADTAVVWDAHIGGIPVCLIGFESRPVTREGIVPADGPSAWTAGTLFPQSSKKIARAINAASANRPIVVLANLSGFDGSPESMRRRQLEFGAEIGRAVTNFDGPIVFVVISRYHGGAFVVFSKRLTEHLEVAAVEGSYASVIGGAPAAAVVFAHEVDARTKSDPRLVAAAERMADLEGHEQEQQEAARELDALTDAVRSEKLGEVAEEFDRVHSIQRALEVGSVDRIIAATSLRPYLVDALERGIDLTVSEATSGTEPPR